MRTRQALKNTVASLLLQVVLALSGIVVPRFFTALYGSAVNGLVSSVSQFISYMSLVEAGVGAAGTVALYGPLARQEQDRINRILSAARSFYLRSGVIFGALLAVLVVLYPAAVRSEIADTAFIRMMILVLSVNGIVDYFFLGKYRVLLQADQRGYVISLIQIAGTVVMTAVSLLLIRWEVSSLLVKGAAAAVYLLRGVAVAAYVRRHYPWVDFRQKPDMGAFSQRWAALLHQIVGMVVNNTDIVLLTLLLKVGALAEVSVYSVYNLVAYSLSGLMNSISNGLGSGFGQVISQKEERVLHQSFASYEFLFFTVIFIAYTCMAVLLHPFVSLYSAAFTDGVVYVRWELVALFSLAGLLQSVRLPGLTILCAAGHYKQTQSRAVLEAVINLGVSLLLIGPMGINGVLIGTCLSYLYRTTDVIIYSARHFLPGTLKKTSRRLLRNSVTAAVLTMLGLRLIPQEMSGWLSWLGWAVAGGCGICGGFLAINLAFEPAQRRMLLDRVKALLRK